MEELFAYTFGIYIRFGYQNPLTLTLYNSVDVVILAESRVHTYFALSVDSV